MFSNLINNNRLGGCGQIGKQEESSTKRHLLPLQVAADTQFSWLLSFDQSTIKILSIKGNWHIAPISSLSKFFMADILIPRLWEIQPSGATDTYGKWTPLPLPFAKGANNWLS